MEDSLSKEQEEPPTKKSKDSAMHFLLEISSKQQAIATSCDELQHFIKEPTLDPDSNALEWWKKHHERFPRVAKLAKRFVCPCYVRASRKSIFYLWKYSLDQA